ncbi:uncharacterized protein LOC143459706 isoform X2 [Clavelina lepadiformis]|uniref:uncharacterized protein LOC143459706 isoform X2 n=1 Tax=Clavelina lepadiformis TaxID=159417 RepID=UPI004043671B
MGLEYSSVMSRRKQAKPQHMNENLNKSEEFCSEKANFGNYVMVPAMGSQIGQRSAGQQFKDHGEMESSPRGVPPPTSAGFSGESRCSISDTTLSSSPSTSSAFMNTTSFVTSHGQAIVRSTRASMVTSQDILEENRKETTKFKVARDIDHKERTEETSTMKEENSTPETLSSPDDGSASSTYLPDSRDQSGIGEFNASLSPPLDDGKISHTPPDVANKQSEDGNLEESENSLYIAEDEDPDVDASVDQNKEIQLQHPSTSQEEVAKHQDIEEPYEMDERNEPKDLRAELDEVKEQMKLLQQNFAYQFQLIHLLQWQVNMLAQQRQQNNAAVANMQRSPNDTSFNPLSQLFANNNARASPDQAQFSSAMALAMKTRKILDSVPTNGEPGGPSSSYLVPNGEKIQDKSPELQRDLFGFNKEVMMRALQQRQQLYNPAVFNNPQAGGSPNLFLPEHLSAMFRVQDGSQAPADQDTLYRDAKGNESSKSLPSRKELPKALNATNRKAEKNAAKNNKKDSAGASNGDGETFVKNQCHTCRRILSCPSALKLHYRTHTGERPYQCDLCSRAFTTRGNLRTHYSSVHRRELPPASASSATSMARRNMAQKSNSSFACTLCNSNFENQMALAQHMQMHAVSSKQQHNTAPQMMAMKQNVMQPEQTAALYYPQNQMHAPEKVFGLSARADNTGHNVALCSPTAPSSAVSFKKEMSALERKKAQDALDLTTASSSKTSDDAGNYARQEAGSPSSEKENFHRGPEHSPNMRRTIPFKALDDSYEDDDDDDKRPPYYACGICLGHFETETGLQEHAQTHEGASDNPSSSQQEPGTSDEQRRSVKRAHSDQGSSEGPEPKRSGNPRHWCDICQKQFSSASSLQIHTRTHTGEKPYGCIICKRAFTTKGNLKVHMGTHVWGVGGSRRGRRVSMDNPVMSSLMRSSTNVESVSSSASRQCLPEQETPTQAAATQAAATQAAATQAAATQAAVKQAAAAASIYQQLVAQGFLNRNQNEAGTTFPNNPMMTLAASQYLQQQAPNAQESNSHSTANSPENRTEASSSSDGEPEQSEMPSANAANEWLWNAYQRTQGQVN